MISICIFESLALFFALTYLDVLTAFNSIDSNFFYYVFKFGLTSILSCLLIIWFIWLFRLTPDHEYKMISTKNSINNWHEKVLFQEEKPSKWFWILISITVIICFIYTLVVTKLSKGMCIALHNDFGLLIGDVSVTTAWSWSSDTFCWSD